MDEQELGYEVGKFIGIITVGSVTGGLIAWLAARKNRYLFAIIAFLICMGGAFYKGIFAAVPAAVVLFVVLVVTDYFGKPGAHDLSYQQPVRRGGGGCTSCSCLFGGITTFIALGIFGLGGWFIYSRKPESESFSDAVKRTVKEKSQFLNPNRFEAEAEPEPTVEKPPVISMSSPNEFREFTSRNGKKIEGKLLSYDGRTVELMRKDGKIYRSSIEIYSAEDQVYIRSFLKNP